MNALTENARMNMSTLPRWGSRDLSHLASPGRWYVQELIEMARVAVASAMPAVQALSMQGQSIELLTYLHKSDGLNWGDVRLVQKGGPAPDGFELVEMPSAITGATPYQAMATCLIEKHLLSLPLLSMVPSPYIPLHLRGENKIIAAERDEEGKHWTVSFRQGSSPYAVIGQENSISVRPGNEVDGYVVQRDGSAELSRGGDSFWYSATPGQNGRDLALSMMSKLALGESDQQRMR